MRRVIAVFIVISFIALCFFGCSGKTEADSNKPADSSKAADSGKAPDNGKAADLAMVSDFENGDISGWSTVKDKMDLNLSAGEGNNSKYGLKTNYKCDADCWFAVFSDPSFNASGYAGISFDMLGTGSGAGFKLDLSDAGSEEFVYDFKDDFSGWKTIAADFREFQSRSDWQPEDASVNDTFDKGVLHNLGILNGAIQGEGSLTIDNIAFYKTAVNPEPDDETEKDAFILGGDGMLDPYKQKEAVGKCVNLGNMLDTPRPEGSWDGITVQEEYLQVIAQKGFNSVRIPIRWSDYALSDAPYTIEDSFFKRIDQVLKWTLDNKLSAIIDMHHYMEIHTDPDNHKQRWIGLWKQIAERYKDYPNNVYYEILNEPNDKLTPEKWNDFLYDCILEIRKIDSHHTIIVPGPEWSNIWQLKSLRLPEIIKNAIVTFHYYTPFTFTHQGTTWGGPDVATTGIRFPGPPEDPITPAPGVSEQVKDWIEKYNTVKDPELNPSGYKVIRDELDVAYKWGIAHNRPMFMGEFGAWKAADMTSRANWTAYVREQLEERDISWAYWEFCAGLGVWDRSKGDWVPELIRALGF